MDTTPGLLAATNDWLSAAEQVIDAASRATLLSVRTLEEGSFPAEADPQAAVDAFLVASGGILSELPDFSQQESLFPEPEPVGEATREDEGSTAEEEIRLREDAESRLDEEWEEPLERTIVPVDVEEDEDLDAANRALALVAGCLSLVDVLLGAAESPSTIRAEFRLARLAEFGTDARREVARFADVMNGGSVMADADPPATLPGELHRLGDAAGTETVSLATFGIGAKEIPSLMGALQDVVGASRDGAAAIGVLLALKGFVNKLKREAAKILKWLLDRIERLLPPGAKQIVSPLSASPSFDFLRPGHIVGEAEVAIFGSRRLLASWNGLDEATRPQIPDTLIEPALEHIGWITQGRRAVGTFGTRVVLVVAHSNPAVAIAYYAVVAMAITFVVAQAGFGVRALGLPMTGL